MPPKNLSRERAKNKLPVGFATQVIPESQVSVEAESSNNGALPARGVTTHNTSSSDESLSFAFEYPPVTPSWRCKEAPRLLQTDTTEHVLVSGKVGAHTRDNETDRWLR